MRVAVVEYNYWHDEILPTVVYAFNRLGAVPDVYVPSRAARKDAFAHAPSLRYRLRLIDDPSRVRDRLARIRGTPARYGRYDVLFVNSIEPAAALEAAASVDLPTIALIHNANLLEDDVTYRAFFAGPARQPLFLGRHVARNLGQRFGQGWLAPVFLGDAPVDAARDGRQRLCVSGNVEFVRRDYASLLEAIAELAPERSDFIVQVVGRSDSRDGRDLRERIAVRGLTDRFTFTSGEIGHGRYLSMVGSSDFILPLIDSGSGSLASYFEVKITSSMSMAIGLGVIPIADARLADLYQVGDVAVTYGPGDLADGIRAALGLPSAERVERRRRLFEIRADALEASVRNLAAALDRLGVAHG